MLKRMNDKINEKMLKAMLALESFRNNEEGDTNFISIMIILGVVVVFAGAFSLLGDEVIDTVGQKIRDFLDSLG